ncbi:MAG: transporter [Rhizobiaceae bacterium]
MIFRLICSMLQRKSLILFLAMSGCIALISVPTRADDSADLAKKLANPIASLISVPFQFNYDSGFGPLNGDQVLLNVQPVIPFSLNEDWNLITRTIVPVKWTNDIAGPSGRQFGLGDTSASFWFSPKEPTDGGIIWGLGPIAYLPTATDSLLGTNLWGAGPTAIVLKQQGPWTYGALANHIWSFESTAINSTYLQPFLSYSTPSAWTFSLNTESTYDWTTEQWNAPVNFMISKVLKVQNQPIQIQGGVGYFVDSPTGSADEWRARFAVTFLFPK